MKCVEASGNALIICFLSAKDDSFKAKYSSETVFTKVITLYTKVPAQISENATNRTAEGLHNCKICRCSAFKLVVTS